VDKTTHFFHDRNIIDVMTKENISEGCLNLHLFTAVSLCRTKTGWQEIPDEVSIYLEYCKQAFPKMTLLATVLQGERGDSVHH